jgi:hypothetical protein
MDMIGKINPPSSKGHQYILAIIDYFTKWVEAIPMKSVISKDSSDHHGRWRIGLHIKGIQEVRR